jgi:hypothetical protein
MPDNTRSTALLDYWRRHIGAWQRSGQSQMAYCKTRQLAYHRFAYWRRKLQAGPNTPQPRASSALVPVTYQPSPTSEGLSLSLPNGMTLRGISADNVDLVSQLLEQLR